VSVLLQRLDFILVELKANNTQSALRAVTSLIEGVEHQDLRNARVVVWTPKNVKKFGRDCFDACDRHMSPVKFEKWLKKQVDTNSKFKELKVRK
jgi:hypothetical protein